MGGMSPPNEVNDVCSNTISKAHKIGLKSMILMNDDEFYDRQLSINLEDHIMILC